MDETHVKARDSAGKGRIGIIMMIRPVNLRKPEVIMPDSLSGAGACTAVFTVSAAGRLAPHVVVVEGATPGHATVRVTQPRGQVDTVVLASFLNDSALVWRRTPRTIRHSFGGGLPERFGARSAAESPWFGHMGVDGATVHLSPKGLITLLRSKTHVISEPSKMSHICKHLRTPAR